MCPMETDELNSQGLPIAKAHHPPQPADLIPQAVSTARQQELALGRSFRPSPEF